MPKSRKRHEKKRRGRPTITSKGPRMDVDAPLPSREVTVGYYLVAFLDALGQSTELLKLTALPQTAEERQAMIETLKRTGGTVKAVRDGFDNFIHTLAKPSAVLSSAPPHPVLSYLRSRPPRIRHRGVSDSFIITVPLLDGGSVAEKMCVARDVRLALLGVAGISLAALGAGVPLRGGIDVGIGCDLFPGEVYGPALATAYALESKKAQYPRTLVGSGLLDYLAELESLPTQDPFLAIAQATGAGSRTLICTAPDDGLPMLNMLSPLIMQTAPWLATFVAKATVWVTAQASKYQAENNVALAERYGRLKKYFDDGARVGQAAAEARWEGSWP